MIREILIKKYNYLVVLHLHISASLFFLDLSSFIRSFFLLYDE